ncbi:MAG TPA: bifunctional 4-hydroxy-2-oxoglutarate aldolase/2-dehydro-3-deoxy-phosphogluconate aldolase [Chloroflexi bacterium]|nr:bifunctional 4-hydroxy-2-oxoglutarate aldolase/2-dehydro-3-deoxy-phosphogluconate aldolase [Chloroflexota bacterium]
MARFSRVQVWSTMEQIGMVPLFYNGDVETSVQIAGALAAGGARVIEFTNRGDRAFEVFREMVVRLEKDHPQVILGVGSVLDPATAGLYINLGANFIVGSVTNPEVAKLCNRRKIAYFPGCATASEVSAAEELGCEIVKVFPGSELGGPSFVKAITAPCPWSKIMPTGGVEASYENIMGWFDAGVVCIGMGSAVVRSDLVKAKDWGAITKLTAQCLAWVRQARGQALYSGVEHVGLYPTATASAQDIAAWYNKLFGFEVAEGNSSIFLSSDGAGRIEVMKSEPDRPCHLAVRVSDFEAAVADLEARGVELSEPTIRPNVKSAYLKEPDPAGNTVHILWMP